MLRLLRPHPAALIEAEGAKTLVIADPHLGWELTLYEKGIHVPSQTSKLLQKLTTLLSKYKPDTLLILGDVKYTVVTAEPGEWRDIPEFFIQLKNYVKNIAIVRGNHDANLEPLLPEGIRLLPATGTIVGDVGLFHGHKWPSPMLLKCKTLIMGHLHPVVVFRDPSGLKITRQVWVKAKCHTGQLATLLLQKSNIKVEDSAEATIKKHYNFAPRTTQIFLMPSFNDFLGGRPINEAAQKEGQAPSMIGPVLRSKTVDLDNAEIYLLDGTYLGTLNQLKQL
ncbi:MAG: metallophosphoesterase [Candidatus Bathyarchaeota archaeon]|nr:metallophosphoesterase [Candidatus Bathyarchaeota archaeon]